MKFLNLKKPDDHLLATQVTPPTFGESSHPSYPLQVGKTWDLVGVSMDIPLLGIGIQNHTDSVEVYAVTAVYVKRPLKWWHTVLNRFGADYSPVACIAIDPEHGKFSKSTEGNWRTSCVHLDQFPLYVETDTKFGSIKGVSGNPNVLGFDIDAARINSNHQVR